MQKIYADFMKIDEWPGIAGQSVPLAPVDTQPDLATLEGDTVTLISFDLQAEGKIIRHDGWWFAVLTSAVVDNPMHVAN